MPEEDTILIREYENNPNRYIIDEAIKYLHGKSRDAIPVRWSRNFSKHFSSDR